MTDSGQSVGRRFLWMLAGWALCELWRRVSWVTIASDDSELLKAWRAYYDRAGR